MVRAILRFQVHLIAASVNNLSFVSFVLVTLKLSEFYILIMTIFILNSLILLIFTEIVHPHPFLVFDLPQLPTLVAEPKVLEPRYFDRVLLPLHFDIKSVGHAWLIQVMESIVLVVGE